VGLVARLKVSVSINYGKPWQNQRVKRIIGAHNRTESSGESGNRIRVRSSQRRM